MPNTPRFLRVLNLVLLVSLVACGKDDAPDRTGTPSTGTVGEIADTSMSGVLAFLQAGSYKNWATKQEALIDSVSAHAGKTRTYFNDTAAAAAKANQNPLPKGSILIKDLLDFDGTMLRGQALMAKVSDGAGGDTWVWFEGFLPSYSGSYYGIGHTTCVGCHSSGTDYVRTPVPSAG